MTICANCGEAIKVGATMLPVENGRWRHAEKCGPDLDGMKVRRPGARTAMLEIVK